MNEAIKISPHEEYERIQASIKDPSQFEFIYNCYYQDVFRFIFNRINEPNLTAEIASNTFYKAITKLSSYKYIGKHIKNWILRIAYNELMQYFRQEKAVRLVSLNDQDLEIIERDQDSEKITIDAIIPYLNMLPDEDLTLLELKFFEQMSYREIGEIINIRESNARVRLHRILKTLKAKVQEETKYEK